MMMAKCGFLGVRAFVLVLFLVLVLFVLCACRTVIFQQVVLPEKCDAKLDGLRVSMLMYGDHAVELGKDVPVRVLTDPVISASQNGDASGTRTGDSGGFQPRPVDKPPTE